MCKPYSHIMFETVVLEYVLEDLNDPFCLGELHLLFEFFYDNDVISEEALFAWESCDNQAEAEGKGVAITSTTQFFSWLRQAEDEDDDEVAYWANPFKSSF